MRVIFLLAPRPEDGLFGEETSTFTTDAERQTLRQLMQGAGLVDTTAETAPAFTFERVWSRDSRRSIRAGMSVVMSFSLPGITDMRCPKGLLVSEPGLR